MVRSSYSIINLHACSFNTATAVKVHIGVLNSRKAPWMCIPSNFLPLQFSSSLPCTSNFFHTLSLHCFTDILSSVVPSLFLSFSNLAQISRHMRREPSYSAQPPFLEGFPNTQNVQAGIPVPEGSCTQGDIQWSRNLLHDSEDVRRVIYSTDVATFGPRHSLVGYV